MEKIFTTHLNYLIELAILVAVLLISFNFLNVFFKRVIKKYNNPQMTSFLTLLSKIIKAIILGIVIITVLQNHGYSLTSLVTGVGVTGLFFGFAAKEGIGNFLGSLVVISDKIYNIGDYIIVAGEEGTVEEINLRSTKIRKLDNSLITIPNNIIANTLVRNLTVINNRRLDETLGLVYETSDEKLNRALDIIKAVLKNNSEVKEGFEVFLDGFGDSSINVRVIALVNYPDISNLRRVKEDLLKEILTRFREESIDFAFPSQTLYLKNEN